MGIFCITNKTAGILKQPPDHSEVLETANKACAYFLNVPAGAIHLAGEE